MVTHIQTAPAVATNPVAQSIAEWADSQLADDKSTRYVRLTRKKVVEVAADQGWDDFKLVTAASADKWMTAKALDGQHAQTRRNALSCLRKWGEFLVLREYLNENPFLRLRSPKKVASESYNALTETQARELVEAAMEDEQAQEPKHEAERSVLYLASYGTGLRANELRRLRKKHLHVDAVPPFVEIPARNAKARKIQTTPIPAWLCPHLREWCGPLTPDDFVFRPFPHDRVWVSDFVTAGLLKLNDEGEPIRGTGYVFHSLRHSYVTHLAANGVSEMMLYKLARHSDPRLTERVYTHSRLLPLAQAVATLTDPCIRNPSNEILKISVDGGAVSPYSVPVKPASSNHDHSAPTGPTSLASQTTGLRSGFAGRDSQSSIAGAGFENATAEGCGSSEVERRIPNPQVAGSNPPPSASHCRTHDLGSDSNTRDVSAARPTTSSSEQQRCGLDTPGHGDGLSRGIASPARPDAVSLIDGASGPGQPGATEGCGGRSTLEVQHAGDVTAKTGAPHPSTDVERVLVRTLDQIDRDSQTRNTLVAALLKLQDRKSLLALLGGIGAVAACLIATLSPHDTTPTVVDVVAPWSPCN